MNWIDLVILAVLAFYAWRGYSTGLIHLLVELCGIVVSFLIAVKYYSIGSHLVKTYISVPKTLDDPLGLVLVWLVIEVAYYFFVPSIMKLLPRPVKNSKLNKYGGLLASFVKGVIIVTFAVLVCNLLPLSGRVKTDLHKSKIANFLLSEMTIVDKKLGSNILYEPSLKNTTTPQIPWNGFNKSLSKYFLP